MQQSIMISLMAEDRPGIVESISEVVASLQGNWLESRLARLGGQFAGIIHAQISTDQAEALTEALEQLNSQVLTLTVTTVKSQPSSEPNQRVRFKVVANDRPGIIQEISATIAANGANLEELATDLASAPWSGEPLFHAEGLVALPATLDADGLASRLESLADDLMVEIDIPDKK